MQKNFIFQPLEFSTWGILFTSDLKRVRVVGTPSEKKNYARKKRKLKIIIEYIKLERKGKHISFQHIP